MDVYIPVFRLSQAGGLERYTLNVGTELAARGHQVTFVAPRPAHPIPGTQLIPIASTGSGNTLVYLAEFVTFGIRATPKVRWVARHGVLYGPLGAAFGRGVITAHSCHASWLRDRDRALGPRRRSSLDRALLLQERMTFRNRGVRITTVSPMCAENITACYGVERDQISVAPPAIDRKLFPVRTDEERVTARRRAGLGDDDFVLGIVANHAFTNKRVDLMIEVAARLDATLLVAGISDVHESIHRQHAADLGADVRFLGAVDDMHGFYSGLDVFTLPSVTESYGMAAHEAMAVGVATIVSDGCGIASLFDAGDEATIVRHGDVEQLTEAVEALRDERMRAVAAARGSAWAQQRQWSDVVDDLLPSLEAAERSGRR